MVCRAESSSLVGANLEVQLTLFDIVEVKRCRRCSVVSPISFFSPDVRNHSGLQAICKACGCKENQVFRAKNPGHSARYYQENIERFREVGRKNYWENRERRREYRLKYYRENHSRFIGYVRKRLASKIQATPSWANQNYIRLFYEARGIEEARTGRVVHVDHIVPLRSPNVCGLHCEANLQLMFAEDNLAKSNRWES